MSRRILSLFSEQGLQPWVSTAFRSTHVFGYLCAGTAGKIASHVADNALYDRRSVSPDFICAIELYAGFQAGAIFDALARFRINCWSFCNSQRKIFWRYRHIGRISYCCPYSDCLGVKDICTVPKGMDRLNILFPLR